MVLMGATTYRVMSGYAAKGEPGTDSLAAMSKVVFSTTLHEPLSWPNTKLVARDAVEAVREMKQNGSESMRTMGSLTLCRSLRTGYPDPDTAVRTAAAHLPADRSRTAAVFANALTRHAANDRHRRRPRLVAGLIPDATPGITDPQLLHALRERYQLIEQRADHVLDSEIAAGATWLRHLPRGTDPRQGPATARLVAADRDRWHITSPQPLGPRPDATAARAQQADHRRATTAIALAHAAPLGDLGARSGRLAGRSL